ncbi:vascular cell adhesion protein 1-like isoform X2 [Lepidochelys kempii]|uniref:vascular cell adhesion protein 1-like isoform X2 n=1 Tax=Lepidochelys kempii TaxID=8472 RepID=UPI003C6FC919
MTGRCLCLGLTTLALLRCLPLVYLDPCGLSIVPKEPAVAFRGHVVLNCSSTCSTLAHLGWETSVPKVTNEGPGWASLHISSLAVWDLEPQCYVTSTNIIEKARLHVYRFSHPEIHLGAEMVAGRQEQITCNVSSLVSGSSPSDINVTLSSGGSTLSESRGSPAVGYSFVAQPTQHGQEIVCQAWLRVGPQVLNDSTRATLQVWALPHSVKISVEQLEFGVGANFTVRCSAEGNPLPELLWDLPSNASVELSDRRRTVTVHSAQRAHSGTYQCLAQNRYGASSGHVNISIVEQRHGIMIVVAVLGVISVLGGAGLWLVRRRFMKS